MRSRKLLTLVVSLLVSVVLAAMVISRLRWQDIRQLWRTADAVYLLLGLGAYFCANVLRAYRFRALTGDRIAARVMLRTVIVQNALNTFLPLRAGEVSYLYMVHQSGVVKAGHNVGSLLGARALDLLAALALPLALLPLSHAWSTAGHPFLWFATLAVVAGAGFALCVWRAEQLAQLLASRAQTGRAWLNRALQLGSDMLSSLALLRKGALLTRVASLTLGCWALVYLSGVFSLMGVGVRIPLGDAVFAYSFPTIASMTPFYMLGGFGVYEGSFGAGLHLLGVPLSKAMAAALALHLVELLFVLSLLPVALLLRGQAAQPAEPQPSP